MKLRYWILITGSFCAMSANTTLVAQNRGKLNIVQKPIVFNQKRQQLSLDYLHKRHGIQKTQPTIVPRMIVLHFTGSGTLNSNFNYFNKEEIEQARTANKNQSTLNVSAHFLVDRDGTVYQLLPDTIFARHIIGLNYMAIGVENVGGPDAPLTEAQVRANAALVRHLCARHKIEYLIGHSEYSIFRNTALWKETNSKYYTGKADPGTDFMQKVRALVPDLKLKSKP